MADIKVLFINANGFQQEHSESADSIKMLSLKTANYELTDTKLGKLVDGADAANEHIHDGRYFRENEFISTSAGAGDAGKPVKTDVGGYINGLIDTATLNAALDHGALQGKGDDDHTQYSLASGTRDYTGIVKYSSHPSFSTDTQIVDKKYVDDKVSAVVSGLEWQDSVLDILLTPPGSPTTGDRYLINGTGTGAWATHDYEIAEWNGTAWVFTVPTTGTFVAVDDEVNVVYYFGGAGPWVAKAWEQTTASTGLTKVGYDIRIDSSAAGAGLGFSAGVLSVNTTGALEISGDNVQVKADGINDTHIDWGTGTNQVSGVDVPLADAGNYFTTDNVEAALQQLGNSVLNAGTNYTVGVGGVTKGDLVYVSANDTVLPLSTLTSAKYCIGLALTTESAAATVKVLANDTILTGVLTGATAGDLYFWNGTGFQTTLPTGGGAYVWQVGVAKNATDLAVEVRHVKRNA